MSFQEVHDRFLASIQDDSVIEAGFEDWESEDLEAIGALNSVDNINFYTEMIQYAVDQVDSSDLKRADYICAAVTLAMCSVKDYSIDACADPVVLKAHIHSIVKFATKFPSLMDGIWRSSVFILTESFSPLCEHEPWVTAKVFSTPDEDIFTICQPYLVSLDTAKADRKAALDRCEQLGNFSLFYRECSVGYIAPGSAAVIYSTFYETQKIILSSLDNFFSGHGKADQDGGRFLFPQRGDVTTDSTEFFFEGENAFTTVFGVGLHHVVSTARKQTALTDNEKELMVQEIEGPLKPLQNAFFANAVKITSYLKYLSSPLISRQTGFMCDYIKKYNNLDGYQETVAQLKAQGHPLADTL